MFRIPRSQPIANNHDIRTITYNHNIVNNHVAFIVNNHDIRTMYY